MIATLRRTAGALVAVTVGIALLSGTLLLFTAGRPIVPARLADTPIVVAGPDAATPGDPFALARPWSASRAQELSARLDALPGVAAAIPDRTFFLQGADAGHGWSSTRLGGRTITAGRPPQQAGEVVVDRALGHAPGAAVTLLTATGPTTFTVAGVVDGPGYYLADRAAAELSPGVRSIGLLLDPDADRGRVADAARELLGSDGRVLVGDARSALEPAADARMRWIGMQVLTAIAALSAFVTVFVVASTFAFSVAQRRRELGLLRAVGATPRQVRRLVYREALLVGTTGATVGAVVGAAVAPAVGGLLIDTGFEPSTYTVTLSPLPILAAVLAGPLVALVGAATAARRAARVRPLEALREAAVERRSMGRTRWIVGGLLFALGIALAIGTATAGDAQDGSSFALYGAMVLVTAVAALSPAAVPPIARLCRLPWRTRGGAIGLLVREGALTAARRTASTAAPVLLTVAFAVLVAGLVRTSAAAYATGRATGVGAGWVMVPDGDAPGLTDAAIAGRPGAATLPATVYSGDKALAAVGVDPAAFLANDRAARVVDGSLTQLGEERAVVVPQRADRKAGELYPVTFADGEQVELRVVAVVENGTLRGDLLLSRTLLRSHDSSALTSAVFLATPPNADTPPGQGAQPSWGAGVSPSDVDASPSGVGGSASGTAASPSGVGPSVAGARVVSTAAWAAEADAAEDRLVWVFTLLLIGVSAGYGSIAVANTLLMAAAGRAADLRVARLAGATRRQVLAYVAGESALVVLIGAVLGGAVAFGALLSIQAGLSEQVGAPVDLVVPWGVVGGVVGLCMVLALLAGVLPARRMLRAPAVRAG